MCPLLAILFRSSQHMFRPSMYKNWRSIIGKYISSLLLIHGCLLVNFSYNEICLANNVCSVYIRHTVTSTSQISRHVLRLLWIHLDIYQCIWAYTRFIIFKVSVVINVCCVVLNVIFIPVLFTVGIEMFTLDVCPKLGILIWNTTWPDLTQYLRYPNPYNISLVATVSTQCIT